MKTCADYERAIQAVREVVHRWDPYGLLSAAAARLMSSTLRSQRLLFRSRASGRVPMRCMFCRVYSRRRLSRSAFRPEDCAAVGAEVFEALSVRGLLAG